MTTIAMTGRARTACAKYFAFARVGFQHARAEPGELIGRMVFFVMILGVFSAVWRAVAEASPPDAAREPRSMLWYLAMTEWVLLSAPQVQFLIQEDVQRGDVAYQIVRPVSWLGARFAQGLGALAVRSPVLLVTACGVATFYAGLPERPAALAVTIAFGVAASAAMIGFNVLLGLLAFWLGDIMPAYWIWQKLTFVLGGLLLPLQFYPEGFRRAAWLTPFPALLGGPASLSTREPLVSAVVLAMSLGAWVVAAWVAARIVFRRATARLQLNGG